jgi:prepilin-type N-terminal cleavage/methylation domain-containing protein
MHRPRSAGFTLIELLIVVLIIGVLATIAIPKFANTKGRANLAAMRSDLRNLATAEESYFYSNDKYSSSLSDLNFSTSPGVTITIHEATTAGWSATATSPAAPASCAVFYGAASPVAPASVEAQVRCS